MLAPLVLCNIYQKINIIINMWQTLPNALSLQIPLNISIEKTFCLRIFEFSKKTFQSDFCKKKIQKDEFGRRQLQ